MNRRIRLCSTFVLALFAGAAFATTPSVNGTNIPALSSILDAQNNTWTIVSGVVEKNQIPAGNNYNATLLLLLNQNLYHRNTSNSWYHWNGTSWPATGDPRVISASGARIGVGSAVLVDSAKHVWTLGTDEYAYEDGSRAGGSYNVITLLYFNAVIYAENTSHAWYKWTGSAWAQVAGDPTGSTSGTPSSSGAYIGPGVGTLVDASSNTWSLGTDEYAYENGYRAGGSYNVVEVLFFHNVIYSENTSGNWYSWNGSAWAQIAHDPRGPNLVQYVNYTSPACPAANPTCIPPYVVNTSVAFSKATTKGDAIWVATTVSDYAQIHSITITDSQHNTFYRLNQENDSRPGAQTVAHFYAENIPGGADTITVNWSSDNYKGVVAAEIAGVRTAPLVGSSGNIQNSGITGTKDNVVSGPVSIGAASTPALVVALTMDTNGGASDIGGTGNCALPPGTGFTQLEQVWNWSPAGQAACNLATLQTKTVTAAGTVEGTFTTTHSADPYLTVTAVFH